MMMSAPRQLHKITNQADLTLFGVPGGALGWYYYLAAAQACCSLHQKNCNPNQELNPPIIIAWDKPEKENAQQHATTDDSPVSTTDLASLTKKKRKIGCSAKAYGVYADHCTFWAELSKLSSHERYAYEIIEKGRACKMYWDVEFSICFPSFDEARVRNDISNVLWAWVDFVRVEICNVFDSYSECKQNATRVCILDGTRYQNDPMEIDSDQSAVSSQKKLKFSYHVIFPDVVFESNQSKAYQLFRDRVPSFCEFIQRNPSLDESLTYKPSAQDTGAPDLSVWKDNQIFRFLSCSKRGGSTPLSFLAADSVVSLDYPLLQLSREPFDTFLTYSLDKSKVLTLENVNRGLQKPFPQQHNAEGSGQSAIAGSAADENAISIQVQSKKRKRSAVLQKQPARQKKKSPSSSRVQETEPNDDGENDLDCPSDSHPCEESCLDLVDIFLANYPREIQSMKDNIQELLVKWNNANTIVDRLVRANINLRFQCKNLAERPCIFSKEVHVSNTPLIWLDAPKHISEGTLSDYYLVYYNCQSSECRCDGIIGELHRNPDDPHAYTFVKIFPARLRTQRGPLRSRINEKQAEIRSNLILASSDHPAREPRAEAADKEWERSIFNASQDDYSGAESDAEKEVNVGSMMDSMLEQQRPTTCEHEVCEKPEFIMELRIEGYGWTLREQQKYGIDFSYQYIKRDIERTHCKIESPNVMFLRLNIDPVTQKINSYHAYSHETMSKVIKNKWYLRKKDQDEKPLPVRFFPYWTDDARIRSYKEMKFIPNQENVPPGVLNVWPGFKAERHSTTPGEVQDIDALIGPIRRHILYVLTNQNEEHCDWVLDWMANIVQRPHVRTEVPLVISGKQGVGKGIIFDFFREAVLGTNISSQIQNPGQDLFSRFANKHVDKVFLQIDEGEGMAKYADQLKNIITTKTINYELKGISPLVTENYINIVITTNHERPVLIESSDRRYALFKASDVFLKDDGYYLQLANHLQRTDVARAFFEFLKSRDLSRYPGNFQKSRPLTEYYMQARAASIPILQRFLSAIVNTHRYTLTAADAVGSEQSSGEEGECSCLLLFRDFLKFQECGKFQSSMTQNIFSLKLKGISGLLKKFKRGMHVYQIQYSVLKNALVHNNEYDEDAIID